MKRLLTLVAFFATIQASAQQVNPVPDYVFRNQMSVGRNAVTDTAAYFSIGPRYGATKGFMPPIVGDTATFSSGKRNGLLIFSVQKNKFLYWDSVRVQWSDMAGGSGSYILAGDTSAMLAPYLRKADTTAMLLPYIRHAGYGLTKSGQSFLVDTLNIATRAWRQKGLDSLAALEVSGSGTTNRIAKFTASGTLGNGSIADSSSSVAMTILSSGNIGIGTTAPGSILDVRSSGYNIIRSTGGNGGYFDAYNTSGTRLASFGAESGGDVYFGSRGSSPVIAMTNSTERLRITSGGNVGIGTNNPLQKLVVSNGGVEGIEIVPGALTGQSQIRALNRSTSGYDELVMRAGIYNFQIGTTNAAYIHANGRIGINTTTDAGYQLDVNGTLRSVNGANFATTSGNVLIGTATASSVSTARLSILGSGVQDSYIQVMNGAGGGFLMGSLNGTGMQFYTLTGTQGSETGIKRMEINSNGEVLINPGSDAGDYKLQVSGNIYNTGSAVLAATSGNVGVGVTPSAWSASFDAFQIGNSTSLYDNATGNGTFLGSNYFYNGTNNIYLTSNPANAYALFSGEHRWLTAASGTAGNTVTFTQAMTLNAASELLVNTTSDAGDYKLQVVGNARIGTGKLDIASNTTFGLGIARSGTSEVAGQIYNSNGILYLGAESSAGGQIFSGSSAYAAVIGSGANYPLQFAANNITRATLTTNGNFMIGFPTDTYFYRLQVNGSIFSNNQIIAQNAAAQLNIDSSTNISPLYISNQSLTGSSAQGLFYGSTTWNTTGNPSLIDLAITNTASGSDANYIKISDGSNIFRVTKAAEVVTAAPTGGSIRKWKLGEAATVSPTSPNRTIRVEIDGTVYYLHAKTTND